MKTAIMQLYDMLDEGKISDIAEIKEFYLALEQNQIENAFENGYFEGAKDHPYLTAAGYYDKNFNK